MKVENSIEVQYRVFTSNLNYEFEDLYAFLNHKKLKEIFSTIHYRLIKSFELMNSRLPTHDFTAHFWADPSRDLLESIGVIDSLIRSLKNSEYAFSIDEYYQKIISLCKIFLRQSGGSEIPREMEKIELYYTMSLITILTPRLSVY